MIERLQKILSRAGVASRRGAEQLMLQGRVTCNGETVQELGTRPNLGRTTCASTACGSSAPKAPVYLVLNKPQGRRHARAAIPRGGRR